MWTPYGAGERFRTVTVRQRAQALGDIVKSLIPTHTLPLVSTPFAHTTKWVVNPVITVEGS